MLKAIAVALFVLTAATSGYLPIQHERPATKTLRLRGARVVNVALIGDSLSWQAKASIEASLSGADMPARISVNPGHALSSPWARRALDEDLAGTTFNVLVLETASNDALQAQRHIVSVTRYARILDAEIALAQGRCVVVMNAKVKSWYYRPRDARSINRAIAVAAETYPNVRVVNWNVEAQAHPGWFAADQLHLYPGLSTATLAKGSPNAASQDAAERGFARALQRGIDSCAGPTRLAL